MSENSTRADETFDGGFLPVSAERIEERLAEIWCEANAGDKANRGWSKLCLANTIVITDARTRPEAEATAYALAELHPSRTMLVVIDDFLTYGAFVRTACRFHPDTKEMICWEVIEILASVSRIDDIPGAIRSLIVPSIPVLVVDFSPWQSTAAFDREVMRVSDFYLASDDPFPSRQVHRSFLPFAWFATLPIREMLATMFGHYQRNHAAIYPTGFEIAIQHDKSHALLAGWILNRLNVADSAKVRKAKVEFTLNRRAVTLQVGELPNSESSATIVRIAFSDGTSVEISTELGVGGEVTGYTGRHGDFRTTASAKNYALARYVLESMQNASEIEEYCAAAAAAKQYKLAPKE